jgi:hypothetical protein
MYGSMWLLTATCLACGAPDLMPAAGAAQSGPAPLVTPDSNRVYQDPAQTTGASWGAGSLPPANGCCANSCPCQERPGFLARLLSRLRSLFQGPCEACNGRYACSAQNACSACSESGPLFPRLHHCLASLFRHRCPDGPCCEANPPAMIAQTAPAAVLPPVQPAPATEAVSMIQPVAAAPAPVASPPATEIAKEYLDKVANAEDYSWVTGQLFYIHIHADQGLWVVRYAPVDKEDRYGGSVVLAPAADMSGVQEGDLVTVHGEILNQGRATRFLGGPLYRALDVELKARNRP